jgi:hypothetical protein
MLKTDSDKFNEFAGARVGEVKIKSNMENGWYWLTGNCNSANLRMRTADTPKDLMPGSAYQEVWVGRSGPIGVALHISYRRDEKDMVAVACLAAVEDEGIWSTEDVCCWRI